MSEIKITDNRCPRHQTDVDAYAFNCTEDVRRLHEGIPSYKPTALVNLGDFARHSGIRAMLVKDESTRFGEQAFKPLGGVYAMFRVICREFRLDYRLTTFDQLLHEPQYKEAISRMTFITTTDGNHGRGVSWASGLFGARSYVYMPKGTVPVRAENVRKAGNRGSSECHQACSNGRVETEEGEANAKVEITDMLYDDCVKFTAQLAKNNGWHLIQDTSWQGYEEIPSWIMLGYTTMVYETIAQMKALDYDRPTHVFVQAGVGSMAGAVTAALKATYSDNMPIVSCAEPTQVACIYESMKAADGRPHTSTGNNTTIMAGLNCATPCGIAWNYLRDYSDYAFAVSDDITKDGMRLLAHPNDDDPTIVSGESGAVTTGLVNALLNNPEYKDMKEELGINKDSVILVFSTEGDTDPENYKKIIGDKWRQ